jgi:uncharacterized protein YjiS (DUF1127 family)
MTHLTQSFSLLADVPNRIAGFFEELARKYKKARAASETIKALSKLSNAELHDIGISRGEIHDVAIRTHYGER